MSTQNYRKIECPLCGYNFDALFWTVVRGDIDIELKELILRGDFNTLLCPSCGNKFFYEDNFIYLDPKSQILAFVMPSYEKERYELLEKLKEDYQIIKQDLEEKTQTRLEPYYLFGTGELSDMLKRDMDIEEETEVIIGVCQEMNLKTKEVDRIFAREKDIPFVIPYNTSLHRFDVIDVVKKLIEKNKHLVRLKRLVAVLEESDEPEIEFIK